MRRALLLLVLLLAGPAGASEAPGHGGPVRALALLDGGGLASGSFDQSVILWDASGRARAVLRWHRGAVSALAPLPGGGLASAGEEGVVALWPASPGEAPARVLEGHAGPVEALAAREGLLLSASWDGAARLWDLLGGGARVLEGHRGRVTAAAFRADGAPVTGGEDGTVRAWGPGAPPGGEVLAEAGLPVAALAALPDGSLAYGGADGSVRLLAPSGGGRELLPAGRPVAALSASADGRVVAAASLGGSVSLLDPASGRLLARLEGPGLPVWSVALSPDGSRAWTGGADRRVRAWAVEGGRPLGPLGGEGAGGEGAGGEHGEGGDPQGARVFRACGACHALSAETGPMAGPHLSGLFGRRMGSLPGYAYSERLARGDLVWTPGTVAELFTRGPHAMLPGTRMPEQRVDEPGDLAALLRFLEERTR